MINHYHNNWWCNFNYNFYNKWIYNLHNKWFTIDAMHGGIFKPVHTPWGVWIFFLIKCVCIVEFCLSFLFYFIRQFFYWYVELCWILSNDVVVYIAYIIIVSMYTIYFLLCIQYTFYYVYNIFSLFTWQSAFYILCELYF